MISSFYAALLGLIFLGLTVYIVTQRHKAGVALGDGGDFELSRRIRAHANFAETVPIALLLLFAAEWSGMAVWAVNLCGAALVAGRCFHAYSLLFKEKYSAEGRFLGEIRYRSMGMILTMAAICGPACFLIIHAAQSMFFP